MSALLLAIDAIALGVVVATAVRRAAVRHAAVRAAASSTVLFLDCDDCLYQNNWATAKKITASIAAYTTGKLGVSKEKAYQLYKTHGTCLKGMLVEGTIDRAGAEDYLREVHEISYGDIDADPALGKMLATVKVPMWN